MDTASRALKQDFKIYYPARLKLMVKHGVLKISLNQFGFNGSDPQIYAHYQEHFKATLFTPGPNMWKIQQSSQG